MALCSVLTPCWLCGCLEGGCRETGHSPCSQGAIPLRMSQKLLGLDVWLLGYRVWMGRVCRVPGGGWQCPCPPQGLWLTLWSLVQLKEWVQKLMMALRHPSLPLLELQEIMTSVSGRVPAPVEKSVRRVMAQYAGNITSVLCQFPSQQVRTPASPAPLGGPRVPPWELNFRPPWPLTEHPRWRRLRVSFRALLCRTPAFSPTSLR